MDKKKAKADIERILTNLEFIRVNGGLSAQQVEQRERLKIELEKLGAT